ncbi:MAG: asparagine synthase (glutamine-hydrolyzing) [Alphaproteobacteria bacterium]|nr:asparagine synthase (glutamine-hydrolyzing) [Alphaproteobacteria bacterium]
MCGIFALLLARPLNEADIARGRAGVAALGHRGPDGHGEWVDRDAGVYLGHTRLAIIDPSAANAQPFQREGAVLAYNGETYNFPALRRALEQRGVRFRTRGDTEVVLAALQTWGRAALERFDGQLALVHWDGARARVALDAFGEKQLYVAELADGVALSSELGALTGVLGLRPDLSGDRLLAFLGLGYIPAPDTAYPGVRRLGPATELTVERGRIAASAVYWRPPFGAIGSGPAPPLDDRALDRLQGVLIDGLAGRLISDVPMCLFLSAGVDSALVAAMARRDLGTALSCLTVSFPGAALADETAEAAAVAAHLGLPHRALASARPTRDGIGDLLGLYGQPCEATTALSIRDMAAAAVGEGFKVGLTGSGGDEVVLGYGKHAHFYRHRRIGALPEPFRVALGRLAELGSGLDRHLTRLAAELGTRNHERYVAQRNYPAYPWLREIPGFRSWVRRYFADTDALLTQVSRRELADVMPNSRLIAMDHGSMRASLELRTPFLSCRLVETVAEYDPRAFFAFGQKAVTRRLLKRYLPDYLVERPKRGFVYPPERLLPAAGETLPPIPGVPAAAIAALSRQLTDRGHMRLGVRIALAAAFAARVTAA